MNIGETFRKYEDEYSDFHKIASPLSRRPDIHAFLLLDRLCPGVRDIVSAAEHDEIFLEVDPRALEVVASEGEILELIRCGVRYDSYHDCLAMFV